MRTFSPDGDTRTVSIVSLDQAPGRPSFVSDPVYSGGAVTFTAKLPTADFDGTPLTGLDEFWCFAAYNNSDGTNPIDGLTGQNLLDGGYMKSQNSISMSQAGQDIQVSFTTTPPIGGAILKVAIFVSDGQP